MPTKYVSKRKGKILPEVTQVEEKRPSRLADLLIRKELFEFLEREVCRPKSTKSVDLVPLIEDVLDQPIPDKFSDDVQNAYIFGVLELRDQGKFTPSELEFEVWLEEPRPQFIKSMRERNKLKYAKEDDND